MTNTLKPVVVEHADYGKLNLRRNYVDIKPIAMRKFKIVSQDNEKQIVYLQMLDNQEIIPMTFCVMEHLLKYY